MEEEPKQRHENDSSLDLCQAQGACNNYNPWNRPVGTREKEREKVKVNVSTERNATVAFKFAKMVVSTMAKSTAVSTLVRRWGGYRNVTTASLLKVSSSSSSVWRNFSSSAAMLDSTTDTTTSAETSSNSKIRNIGISAHIDR